MYNDERAGVGNEVTKRSGDHPFGTRQRPVSVSHATLARRE